MVITYIDDIIDTDRIKVDSLVTWLQKLQGGDCARGCICNVM